MFQAELEQYLDVKHVIPCANGTDALQVAMMALGLEPGDEVITADFTYVATAEVIALLNLTPVLVDVLPNTFDIDVNAIEKAITSKTKAIVPVHLFGQCAHMEAINELAKKHNLFVIEDTAQAIGTNYHYSNGTSQKAGTIGTVGCTSFFPSKNLGCYGDGGAIFTNDDALASKIRKVANHGQSVQYIHDEVGVNSRLDSIQAAILRIKLRRLDEYNEARNTAAEKYDTAFKNHPNIITPERSQYSNHVFHQYTLKLIGVDRDALRDHLNKNNIPCGIYYPIPLHLQKAYLDERYTKGDFPVTEDLCKSVISLPMHTELDDEQIECITSTVINFINA
jgi:dTDP-4-amino-4,6-dideoxygalactose transaminase